MILGPLTQAQIDQIWPAFAENIKEACSGNVTPSWLYTSLRKGDALMFSIESKAVFIARFIEDWPGGPVLQIIVLCGTDMKDWLPELRAWQWPALLGVKTVHFEGRTGWPGAKIDGLRIRSYSYEVDVSHGE